MESISFYDLAASFEETECMYGLNILLVNYGYYRLNLVVTWFQVYFNFCSFGTRQFVHLSLCASIQTK